MDRLSLAAKAAKTEIMAKAVRQDRAVKTEIMAKAVRQGRAAIAAQMDPKATVVKAAITAAVKQDKVAKAVRMDSREMVEERSAAVHHMIMSVFRMISPTVEISQEMQ